MGSDSGKLLADAIKAHTNFEQIAQNMFGGDAKVDMSKRGLDAGDAHIMAAALEKNDTVTQVEVSGNALGTAGAKALGDALLVNKTIQHLNVSDNSFGKPMVGDQVMWKQTGELKRITYVDYGGPGRHQLEGSDDSQDPSQFEWESQVPAFCAGLAASTSLLSVSVICAPYTKDVVC